MDGIKAVYIKRLNGVKMMCKVIDFVSSLVIAFILLRCGVTVDTWELWVIAVFMALKSTVNFIDGINKERKMNGKSI